MRHFSLSNNNGLAASGALVPYAGVSVSAFLAAITDASSTHQPGAWIRRRLRMYLWWQLWNWHNRFKELRRHAYQSSELRLPPVHRRDSGACQDTRRSNRPYATSTSSLSVSPVSMSLPKRNLIEPPWYTGVGGAAPRGVPLSRSIPKRFQVALTDSRLLRRLAAPCHRYPVASAGLPGSITSSI